MAGKLILIVEDNERNRKLGSNALAFVWSSLVQIEGPNHRNRLVLPSR